MRINKLVGHLLETRPELRSNDKKLLLAVWEVQGVYLSDQQKQLFLDKCTTPETITRSRREFRTKYPGTEAVEEERYNKFVDYKDNKAVSWL